MNKDPHFQAGEGGGATWEKEIPSPVLATEGQAGGCCELPFLQKGGEDPGTESLSQGQTTRVGPRTGA